jgi:ABC-type bacteriocin/lantibiotic exporter with double-glycine peptidase domain
MDLSVLKGADPTGVRAEKLQKKRAAENPSVKYSEKPPVGDTNQFHVYRRVQRRQAELLEFTNAQKQKTLEKEEFQKHLNARSAELEKQTEKRRQKRQRAKDRKIRSSDP